MRKSNSKLGITILALIICVSCIFGIYAYFTSTDVAVNEVTVGDIKLDLQEPNWVEPDGVFPNDELVKDPQILNNGPNEEYVFLTVQVPYYKDLVTANPDGTVNEPADIELFFYEVNEGWVEVGTPIIDEETGTVTHVYAFASDTEMTVLLPNETTNPLFNSVTFVNAVDNDTLKNSSKEIVINAYGIQTTNVNGGVTDPEGVWDVLYNQVNAIVSTTITVEATDKEGNDLHATANEISGEEKDILLEKLEQSGLVDSVESVEALIEVESDEFDDLAETTFDVSNIAQAGDKVVILHFDESTSEWEFVAEEIVNSDGKVTADFSGYSPVAFVVINPDGSMDTVEPNILAASNTWYKGSLSPNSITTITFVDNGVAPEVYSESWDASAAQNGNIIGYLNGTDVYVVSNKTIVSNEDSSYMFSDGSVPGRMYSLVSITGLEAIDTSNVTNMDCMFYATEKLASLDLSSFVTDNVTSMQGMFSECSCLTSLDLSSFDTSNVANMNYMFNYCLKLNTIYVSDKWNTSNVTESADMFSSDTLLVGGNGTVHNAAHVDGSYAHIDAPGNPGYLTLKN